VNFGSLSRTRTLDFVKVEVCACQNHQQRLYLLFAEHAIFNLAFKYFLSAFVAPYQPVQLKFVFLGLHARIMD
jgi:hypothetical protein